MMEQNVVSSRTMSEAERVKAKANARQLVAELGDIAVRPYLVDALVEMGRLRRSNDAMALEVEHHRRCSRAARMLAAGASALAAVRVAGYGLAVTGGVLVGAVAF